MRKVVLTIAFVLVAALARAQTVHVISNTEIARENEPRRFSEPHLAIHPTDPRRMIAAAFVLTAAGTTEEQHATQRCVTFSTVDAGVTWTKHEFPFADCGDPQVAFLPSGEALFLALAELPGILPKRSSWMFAFHSADGVTWDAAPAVVGRPHDHPTVAVDTGSEKRKGWIYVQTNFQPRDGSGQLAPQLFVVRSRDNGNSFDPPVTMRANNLSLFGETVVVMNDGTVVASYGDDTGTRPFVRGRRYWVVRSTDGGTTFSLPMFVTDVCGPPPSFQLSNLAVDKSDGPLRDRLYFACRRSDGGPVVVTSSGDRGETWNRPGVSVENSPDDTTARRVMTMAVNNKGVLGVIVVERKPNTAECLSTNFYTSLDGGASFLSPTRISSSSCGTAAADEIAGRMIPTYGDYFGLTSTPDGRFMAMWPEMRNGHSVLMTSTIEVEGRVVPPPKK